MRIQKSAAVLLLMMFLLALPLSASSFLETAMAEETDVSAQEDADGRDASMPTNQSMYITLAENTSYRWNANDNASKYSVIHLDDADGENRFYRLDHIEKGWYGIKHLKDFGDDYFVDIDGKSKNSGAVVHLFERRDEKVKGENHRQFGFYPAGTDAAGNKLYYIQNRNSGLWLGVQDNDISEDSKIVQTDIDYRKAWIVTKAVIPLNGKEAKVLKDSDTKGYIELFEKGSLAAINAEGNLVTARTKMHHFELGTSSKWLIRWNDTYKAYEIEYAARHEEGSTLVWDVKGESENIGADIHLWQREDHHKNANTTQLWRFITQSDGSIKIQNAANGRYLAPGSNRDSTLELSGSGAKYTLSVLDGDTGRASNQTNFAYAANWMKDIPDAAYLSSVNIPGSHDTGTAAIFQDGIPQFSFTSCQKLFYGEQLNVGARSFDIRCNASSSTATPKKVKIIHGSSFAQCYNRDESDLTLDDIFTESVRFLNEHETETIILVIKPDSGSTAGLAHAVGDFIKNNKNRVWMGEGIPSMGEARGKIVFMRRYEIKKSDYDPASDGLEERYFGPYLKDWDKAEYDNQTYAIRIYQEDDTEVYVQDAYQTVSSNKWRYIEGTFKQTTGKDTSHAIPSAAWVFNFTSSARGVPLEIARDINPRVYADKGNYFSYQRLGMVMHNYIDTPLAQQIYQTNNDKSRFYATKVKFPEGISLYYGQSLASAQDEMNRNNTQVAGTFRFELPGYVPTWEDYENGKEFSVTFTPSDTRLSSVTETVTIAELKKKPMVVYVHDASIRYGQTDPSFTFTFDSDELVGTDTLADLAFTVTVEGKELSSAGFTKAGSYVLGGSSASQKYDITVSKGTFTVAQKTLGVSWSDTRNLVWTGQPMNITATLAEVEPGDSCTPVITGGDAVGPSWDGTPAAPEVYTARIADLTGADASNYYVREDDSAHKYLIRRTVPGDYNFPERAVLTYGESLSQAELIAASGDGEFRFVENEAGIDIDPATEVPLAGDYTYKIGFYPTNSGTEHAVFSDIAVTVKKKHVVVQAKHTVKIYGEATTLDFEVAVNDLVSGDTEDNLGIVLTSTHPEKGSGDGYDSPAGVYTISGSQDSSVSTNNHSYDVEVVSAKLLIRRRAIAPSWPIEDQFTYNGNPVAATATVPSSSLLFGDSCSVEVYNGNAIDAGDYAAVAYHLSNTNYRLDLSSGQIIWQYSIGQAIPAAVFPGTVELVYGQALSEASMSGQEGEGSFAFADPHLQPTVAESGSSYQMVFTPTDGRNYQSITQNVAVTVLPKALTVSADAKRKTYGDETPSLSYSVDEAQLVGNDTVDDLHLDLTLDAGEGAKTDCDAAMYEIVTIGNPIWDNVNYDIVYQSEYVTVDPLTLTTRWSDTSDLVYTGKPVSVTATLETVLFDDECQAVVEGGTEIGPSWQANQPQDRIEYTAEIVDLVGADRFNYVLSDEAETEKSYVIEPVSEPDPDDPSDPDDPPHPVDPDDGDSSVIPRAADPVPLFLVGVFCLASALLLLGGYIMRRRSTA